MWFVAYTNDRAEKRTAVGLAAKGFSVFLPVRAAWVSHARQRLRMEYPLFPRYLFVGVVSPADLPRLRGVSGLEAILKNNDVPVKVPADVINEFARACARGDFDDTRPRPPGPLPRPGDQVDIVAGPFASFGGVVASSLSPECIKVLVDIFGRETLVQLPLEYLRAA